MSGETDLHFDIKGGLWFATAPSPSSSIPAFAVSFPLSACPSCRKSNPFQTNNPIKSFICYRRKQAMKQNWLRVLYHESLMVTSRGLTKSDGVSDYIEHNIYSYSSLFFTYIYHRVSVSMNILYCLIYTIIKW